VGIDFCKTNLETPCVRFKLGIGLFGLTCLVSPDFSLVGKLTDITRTSICDKYSGFMKITTHLDHISHCKTASGTNWSTGWTYRVFIMNTRSD
jgi:hypothetical protein